MIDGKNELNENEEMKNTDHRVKYKMKAEK